MARPPLPIAALEAAVPQGGPSDLSIMTYNVKGLPWPVATGRGAALDRIGERLAWMRSAGFQPGVVVLQEAFISDAKAIGDKAGYRYQVLGADAQLPTAKPVSKRTPFFRRSPESQLDSGLMVLSDYPVLDVRRATFPDGACAGFDCFAAKGVVLVTLSVPGKGKVAVATTHLNSRGASWASGQETERAYREQVAFLADFIDNERDPAIPLVLAGDFNLGDRPERLAILRPALSVLNDGEAPHESLRNFVVAADTPVGQSDDAQWVVHRARDMQYILPGGANTLDPIAASIPFGTEARGKPLSDHFGYTIEYRLTGADGLARVASSAGAIGTR